MIEEIADAVRAVAPLGSVLLTGIAVTVASRSLRRSNESYSYTVSRDARSRLEETLFDLITSVADLELAVRAWPDEVKAKPERVDDAWRSFVLAHSKIDVLVKQARPQDEFVLFAASNICGSASMEERYPVDGYGGRRGSAAATFSHAEGIDREMQGLPRGLDGAAQGKYPPIGKWWEEVEGKVPGYFDDSVQYRIHFSFMVRQFRYDYLVPWVADFSDHHMQSTLNELH